MKFKGLIKKLSLVLAVLTFLLPGRAVFAGGEEITFFDMAASNCKFATMLLNNVDSAIGMEKGADGNLLKKEKLTKEEQIVYNDIQNVVNGLVKEAESDKAVLSSDVKKTKAIYNWISKNIKYDKSSLCSYTDFDFDKGIGGRVISENPDRKPQDAISVYKGKKAVCAGYASLFELMMRMADLPCVYLGNAVHVFNAAWLDRGDGKPCWMLIDSTPTNDPIQVEFGTRVFEQGEDIGKPFQYDSVNCNRAFINVGWGNHFVYCVFPPMTELGKDLGQGQKVSAGGLVVIDDVEITGGASIYCRDGFDYAGAVYDRKSSTSQVFALPEGLICLHKWWKLAGDFKSIKDLKLFVEKGICLDISESAFEKVVEKDGVEFKVSGGGFGPKKDSEGKPVYPKSVLHIKPKSGVSVSEVEIPEELKVFVGDIGAISVESDSIKTVKYSLLKQCSSLKEGVELSAGVNFENVTKPSENV